MAPHRSIGPWPASVAAMAGGSLPSSLAGLAKSGREHHQGRARSAGQGAPQLVEGPLTNELLEGLPELGIEAHAFVSDGLQSLSIVDQFQKGHSGSPIPSIPPVRRD